ncbi:MAG: dephospho-CoA kinase [Gammaproteobacteria bacterium]|nr:MAG: dephospho-CoA kinase [Gammaproteobacteria bacterium]
MRVGLTGGIASGKSTVAQAFEALGVSVIDTDVIAREVVAPGSPALAEIREAFGEAVLEAAGGLDRRRMRELVFADAARRRQLEAILHPRIRAATLARADAAPGDYVVIAVPLLVETGFDRLVAQVVVVDCPEALQLARLMQRDGQDEAAARRMLAAQTSREARLARADHVIDNSGTLAETQAQVAALHAELRAAADRIC